MYAMTLDQIRYIAPSVFAETPYAALSHKYRMFPTAQIVTGLIAQGFAPVRAQQSRTRIEGKAPFTKHLLRFRRQDDLMADVNSEVPEIVLLNSHDGSSAYQISLGLFRVRCTNGLVVKSAGIEEVRVRHSGKPSLVDDVIEGSFRVIEQAPQVLAQVQEWKALALTAPEQRLLAEAALEVRETSLEVEPAHVLAPRRRDDVGADLYRTMNVVQENLMRGGIYGRNEQQQRRRLQGVKSVDGDTRINRALWVLAEKMAELKRAS